MSIINKLNETGKSAIDMLSLAAETTVSKCAKLSDEFRDTGDAMYTRVENHEVVRATMNLANQTANTAREAANTAVSTTGSIINTVSGENTLNAVKELLENQRRYNDILATRLAEALCRIEQLEKKIGHASNDC